MDNSPAVDLPMGTVETDPAAGSRARLPLGLTFDDVLLQPGE